MNKYLYIIVGIAAVVLFFVMSKGSSASIQAAPRVEPISTGQSNFDDVASSERIAKQQIAQSLFTDLLGYQIAQKTLDLKYQLAKEGKSFS